MKDLFGHEIHPATLRKRSPRPKKTGYAFPPGTGPAGKTCADCVSCYRREGGSKHFYKCRHDRAPEPTGGPGTDIKLKSPACQGFAEVPRLFYAWAVSRLETFEGSAPRSFHSEARYFRILASGLVRIFDGSFAFPDTPYRDYSEADAIAEGRAILAREGKG